MEFKVGQEVWAREKTKCPGCGSEDTYVALWREDDDRKRRTGIK